MSDLITILPVEMQHEIANKIDLQSLPYFMSACKTTSAEFNNTYYINRIADNVETRLSDVIDVIKEYHISLHKNDVWERIAKKILKETYKIYHKAKGLEKVRIYECLDQIKTIVVNDTGCPRDTVTQVWMMMNIDVSFNNQLQHIADSLIKSLLPKSEYTVNFQYIDRKERGRYYIQFSLCLEDINKPTVAFYIQDLVTEREQHEDYKKLVYMIPTAVIDADGWTHFELTSPNLRAMVEYVLKVFGNETFMFETDMISYIEVWNNLWFLISSDTFSNIVKDEMSGDVFRNKLIDILN